MQIIHISVWVNYRNKVYKGNELTISLSVHVKDKSTNNK